MKEALIIFVKNPEPGKVKTRIALTMGNDKAVSIYKDLLDYTKVVSKQMHCDKFIFYGDGINLNDTWDNETYFKETQHGIDLGERMKNAFDYVFNKGYNSACIIGSDCMEITNDIIKSAFDGLNKNEVIIGPSTDGGYYLLGMKQTNSVLFLNKSWSTEHLLTQTIQDLKNLQFTYQLLDPLTDIDTEQDWLNYLSKRNVP